jgi:hypothetical protein
MTTPVRRHDIKYKDTARTTLSIFYCCAESIYTEFHFTEHLYAEFYVLSIIILTVVVAPLTFFVIILDACSLRSCLSYQNPYCFFLFQRVSIT